MALPRVLLADDHPAVAERLRKLIKEECQLVGMASDGPSLVAQALELRPDVIVADMSMPGFDGLEALRRLRKAGIAAKIIILTMYTDPGLAEEVLAAGGDGYVIKHAAGEELLAAIRLVLAGATYVTPSPKGAVS